MRVRWAASVLFIYALHFVWEMAQAPLFQPIALQPFWQGTGWCARAAAWDVMIAIVTYGFASLATVDGRWPRRRLLRGTAIFVVTGLVITITIERWATAAGRWQYAPAMPAIAGIGVTPLLQWIVLPLATVAVLRAAFTSHA